METKFTKGKWHTYISPEKKEAYISANKTYFMAQVFCRETNMDFEETTANAKLIAAAPDMFNALRDLYDDKEVWSDLFESQQEFICRVLNKATDSNFFKH